MVAHLQSNLENEEMMNEIDKRFYNLMKNKQRYYVYMPTKSNKPLKSPVMKPKIEKIDSSQKVVLLGDKDNSKVPKLKVKKSKGASKSMLEISRYWI